MGAAGFADFEAIEVQTEEAGIFLRRAGSGPPLLLLHGFPETHLMWRGVAPVLSKHFTVICADLRGYGDSSCPASNDSHAAYTKRAMARDMISVMATLGFPRFSVAGHDRGGRVAYRLALDHPDCVQRLAVLDIIPIADAWERADKEFMLGYWPWSLLAQPEPLPEQLLLASADVIVDNARDNWGSAGAAFGGEERAAYVSMLRDQAHAHAICEEYRAAATLDHEHDRADRDAGRRIVCPVLVLWSRHGPLGSWYQNEGGPLALWRAWATEANGCAVDAGHFFPEELPNETGKELAGFFNGASRTTKV